MSDPHVIHASQWDYSIFYGIEATDPANYDTVLPWMNQSIIHDRAADDVFFEIKGDFWGYSRPPYRTGVVLFTVCSEPALRHSRADHKAASRTTAARQILATSPIFNGRFDATATRRLWTWRNDAAMRQRRLWSFKLMRQVGACATPTLLGGFQLPLSK